MSKTHTQGAVNTLIPKGDVTDFEIRMLHDHGFESREIGDNYFFYAEEFISDTVDGYDILRHCDYIEARGIPENLVYFSDDSDYDLTSNDYVSIFQNIIKRSKDLIAVEIASVCHQKSKIEPGWRWPTGFAEIITKDNRAIKATTDLFMDMRAELGLPRGHAVGIVNGSVDAEFILKSRELDIPATELGHAGEDEGATDGMGMG
jgi:hypothetical protein